MTINEVCEHALGSQPKENIGTAAYYGHKLQNLGFRRTRHHSFLQFWQLSSNIRVESALKDLMKTLQDDGSAHTTTVAGSGVVLKSPKL